MMEIKIENSELVAALATAVKDSLTAGAKSWEIKKALDDAAREAIMSSGIAEKLATEITQQAQEAAPAIVAMVAAEVLPAMKVAIGYAMREAMTAMIYGLRSGRPSYMSDTEKERWASVAKMFETADVEVES